MRILCTADPHNEKKFIEGISKVIKKENIDVFICAGDFHAIEYSEKLLSSLPVPSLTVPGNWDCECYIDEKTFCSDFGIVELNGYHFFLVGNNFPFNFDQAALMATEKIKAKKLILVTHYPPYGILDRLWSGRHVGYPEFEKFIKAKKPLLHIFGHIHEDTGIEKVKGGTICINCSLAETKNGFIVDTENIDSIKEIRVV